MRLGKPLGTFTLISALVLSGGVPAFAGQGGKLLKLNLDRVVERADALIFSERHVSMTPVEIEKQGKAQTAVTVTLPPDPLYQRRFVTVVGTTKAGDTAYTEVHEASNQEGDDSVTAFCTDSPRRAAHEQLPLLQSQAVQDLVDVRKRKRELMLERIRAQLTPQLLDTLRAAEEAYGLRGTPTLAQDMPMDQLLWRLAAIQTMAQNRLPRKR